jgi:subfamily B ATP-binding cassette protein MsbA
MAAASAHGLALYRCLLGYVQPYRRVLGVALLGRVLYAATDMAFAALMQPLLDGSFVDQDPVVIRGVPLALIGIFAMRGSAGFVTTYAMSWVGRQVVQRLRTTLFAHLLPLAFFDRTPSGELIAKLTYDVEQVAQASTTAVTVLVRDSLTVVGLLVWMGYLNGLLTLVFLLVGPVIAGLMGAISHRSCRLNQGIQTSLGRVIQVAKEAIEGQCVVKTFGGEAYERRCFAQVDEANRRLDMQLVATNAASVPAVQLVAASALVS